MIHQETRWSSRASKNKWMWQQIHLRETRQQGSFAEWTEHWLKWSLKPIHSPARESGSSVVGTKGLSCRQIKCEQLGSAPNLRAELQVHRTSRKCPKAIQQRMTAMWTHGLLTVVLSNSLSEPQLREKESMHVSKFQMIHWPFKKRFNINFANEKKKNYCFDTFWVL